MNGNLGRRTGIVQSTNGNFPRQTGADWFCMMQKYDMVIAAVTLICPPDLYGPTLRLASWSDGRDGTGQTGNHGNDSPSFTVVYPACSMKREKLSSNDQFPSANESVF
jgi:hypothetical protein